LRIVSAWVSPSLWQNLMQYRCSKHSVILSETRMRQTRVTPLCYLAATDASGGVARQQKITHAHESPFYHCAQFPHPFAITYRGKKYSRINFGQPSYIWPCVNKISTCTGPSGP
jgi:hypothetical protein